MSNFWKQVTSQAPSQQLTRPSQTSVPLTRMWLSTRTLPVPSGVDEIVAVDPAGQLSATSMWPNDLASVGLVRVPDGVYGVASNSLIAVCAVALRPAPKNAAATKRPRRKQRMLEPQKQGTRLAPGKTSGRLHLRASRYMELLTG